MTLPTDFKPVCLLSERPVHTFWDMMNTTMRCLRRHGYLTQAWDFHKRAMQMNQNDDDTTELLAVISEYVEVK